MHMHTYTCLYMHTQVYFMWPSTSALKYFHLTSLCLEIFVYLTLPSFMSQLKCQFSRKACLDYSGRFIANMCLIFISLCTYAFCNGILQLLSTGCGVYFPSPPISAGHVYLLGPIACNQSSSALEASSGLTFICGPLGTLMPPYKQAHARLLDDERHLAQSFHQSS